MTQFKAKQQITDKYSQVWTIVKRTAKTVLAVGSQDKDIKRFKLSESFGVEMFRPYGSYSMAPVVFADDAE